jgi:tRNA nucleotidyltransferase (CCA-adding enzyme)
MKNGGRQLNIWKRAFLKIRSIKLFSMQEKFRNQVRELEERKLQQLLLSLNYKENVDFG